MTQDGDLDIQIRCPRLLLRTVRPEDAAAFVPLHQDPEVVRLMGAEPTTEEEQRREIEWHRRDRFGRLGWGIFAVIVEDVVIGRAGFRPATVDGEEVVELMYMLLPEYRNRGLATEAVTALMSWAENRRLFERVVAIIHPENAPSIALIRRAGFVEKGRVTYGPLVDALRFERRLGAGR